MANTYNLIASAIVTSSTTPIITFTSIPQTYTDLKIVSSSRTTGTDANYLISLNSSIVRTSGGFTMNVLGTGTSVISQTGTTYGYGSVTNNSSDTANAFASSEWYIPNYTGSNNKSVSVESTRANNATSNISAIAALLVSDTNPITSLSFSMFNTITDPMAQNTTVYIYGIKNS
jgi:hypothetical protein